MVASMYCKGDGLKVCPLPVFLVSFVLREQDLQLTDDSRQLSTTPLLLQHRYCFSSAAFREYGREEFRDIAKFAGAFFVELLPFFLGVDAFPDLAFSCQRIQVPIYQIPGPQSTHI